MAIPEKFYVPWSEIDPDQEDGGLPGELDEFVGARLGDNQSTRNRDLHRIFSDVRDCAASLSMHPQANSEGPPIRNLVEEMIQATNLCLERIIDRCKTTATPYFMWVHAVPPFEHFAQRPIRYPLRNTFASDCVYHLLGALVEIAEVNSNSLHSGLDGQSGAILLAPLLHMKACCAKDYFDKEVEGEISPAELAGLFSNIPAAPTIVQPDDTHPKPTLENVQTALAGLDLIQWYPDESDWAVFAQKNATKFRGERIWQPEGSRPTTEDVAPTDPVPGDGPSVSTTD